MDELSSSFFVFPMGIAAIWILLTNDLINIDENYVYGKFDSNLPDYLCGFSGFYFMTDFILLCTKKAIKDELVYFIHHIVGLLGIFYYYYYGKCQFYLIGFLTYELSTPLLNLLLYYNKNKIINRTYTILQIIFLSIFTVVRIIFGTYLSISMSYNVWILGKNFQILIILLPLALQTLNYFWYFKLLRYAIKYFLGKSKKIE